MAKNDPEKTSRIKQIRQAYQITKKADPWIGIVLLAVFLVTTLLVFGIVAVLFHWLPGIILGIPTGLIPTMIVFGRRAEKAAYAQVEGQPGAAAAALGALRRGWDVKPAVGFTKNQDVVHRVVGRPGIVLVGEGSPNRVRNLLSVERKKHARMVDEVPIHDVIVGDDEGQVPIRKLTKHVTKLPKELRPADVTDVLQRLRALDAMRPQVPMPKGPVPQNPRAAARQARQAMKGR